MRRHWTRTATIVSFFPSFSHTKYCNLFERVCTHFGHPIISFGTFFNFCSPHSVFFRCPFHICANYLLAPFFSVLHFIRRLLNNLSLFLLAYTHHGSSCERKPACQRTHIPKHTAAIVRSSTTYDATKYIYGTETIRCYEKQKKRRKKKQRQQQPATIWWWPVCTRKK